MHAARYIHAPACTRQNGKGPALPRLQQGNGLGSLPAFRRTGHDPRYLAGQQNPVGPEAWRQKAENLLRAGDAHLLFKVEHHIAVDHGHQAAGQRTRQHVGGAIVHPASLGHPGTARLAAPGLDSGFDEATGHVTNQPRRTVGRDGRAHPCVGMLGAGGQPVLQCREVAEASRSNPQHQFQLRPCVQGRRDLRTDRLHPIDPQDLPCRLVRQQRAPQFQEDRFAPCRLHYRPCTFRRACTRT